MAAGLLAADRFAGGSTIFGERVRAARMLNHTTAASLPRLFVPSTKERRSGRPEINGIRALKLLPQFLSDPVAAIQQQYDRHGPIVAVANIDPWSSRKYSFVLAVGEEFNRQIFTDPDTFCSRGLVLAGPAASAHQVLRHGLISMNGAEHRQQRRLLMPPFLKRNINAYHDDIVTHTTEMLQSWKFGQQRDIYGEMHQLSLRIASDVLFGWDEEERSYHTGQKFAEWLSRCFHLKVWLLQLNWPGTPYRKLMELADELHRDLSAKIASRRANPTGRNDVLSLLLNARDDDGTALTDADLIGQTNVLFIASHETLATTLTWTLFLLSQHPQVARDLTDELTGQLRGEPPTSQQFSQLPLLERVIKESMRVLPPVVYGTRRTACDVELGHHHLPEGSRILFSQYMTHHLPELFPQPARFLPDRWLTETPGPYAYIPFGAGPRMCIGYEFSMSMLRTCVAMILQHGQLALAENTRIDRKFAVTMSPSQGMPMIMYRPDANVPHPIATGNIRDSVDLSPATRDPSRTSATAANPSDHRKAA